MKEIELRKYGFIRDKESDFSDDGSRFYCYKAGENVRVSKCTYKGEVYLSARLDGQLPYAEYRKLPHYDALDGLNGYPISEITDEDLYAFYNACVEYEKEYNEAVSKFDFPSFEEIDSKRMELNKEYQKQLFELQREFSLGKFLTLSEYDFKTFKDYYKGIQDRIMTVERVKKFVNTSYSVHFVRSKADTFYFDQCKNMLSKS